MNINDTNNNFKSQAKKMGLFGLFRAKIIIYIIIFILSTINQVYADNQKYWIYFNDNIDRQKTEITTRALQRRQIRGAEKIDSNVDKVPDSRFIQTLKSAGLKIHHISRWLNAVSVSGDSLQLEQIKNFNFVEKISYVSSFNRDRIYSMPYTPEKHTPSILPKTGTAEFDYGNSYTQLNLCQINPLHNQGYSGDGILVGMMDSGYKISHPVFQHILNSNRLNATYDFINNNSYVMGEGIQEQHGTATFSAIGGFIDGALIGAAFGAEFILAKTEIESAEIQSEEDNWIAAAEWMEARGVDIISSSVGYLDWYDQSDMDGNTAAITIAADIAASLGVIVVNSAGNERNNYWNTIIAPADGDSVIAVGGVYSNGTLWPGSSPGPSADGRIKPDVTAMASAVWSADYFSDGYRSFNGTSMSAPVVAGGMALMLEAHPDWSLEKIFTSLKATASNAYTPDNDFGWGIPDFFSMFAIDGYFMITEPEIAVNTGDTIDLYISLFDSLSSPGGNHDIQVTIGGNSSAELIGDVTAIGTDTLVQKIHFPLPGLQKIRILDNISGQTFISKIYVYGSIEFTVVPNPARNNVAFLFDLSRASDAEISIFNVAGDKVKTLRIDQNDTNEGTNRLSWDACNNSGNKIVSGIYIVHLRTSYDSRTTKLAYVR